MTALAEEEVHPQQQQKTMCVMSQSRQWTRHAWALMFRQLRLCLCHLAVCDRTGWPPLTQSIEKVEKEVMRKTWRCCDQQSESAINMTVNREREHRHH